MMDTSNLKLVAFRFDEMGAHTDVGYFGRALDTSDFDEFREQVAAQGGEILNMKETWTTNGSLCVLVAYTLPETDDE